MITHYLKIAVRNLMKYKVQSVISIFGLAVGFVCFALSAMWIRYEMTYDSGMERTYILYKKDLFGNTGFSTSGCYPMSTALKENFPEVEDACAFYYWGNNTIKNEEGKEVKGAYLRGDSCFMNMFGIKLLQGSMDFIYDETKTALTESTARELFGTADVLGKKLKGDQTITAILSDLEHSNFTFGEWEGNRYLSRHQTSWGVLGYQVLVRLKEGVDYKAFEQKMQTTEVEAEGEKAAQLAAFSLMPLSQYHYADFNEAKSLNFTYLMFFSAIGGLVILCSLFNYLALFVNRMQTRLREIELRKLCGASLGSLLALFSIEYVVVILWGGFFGMMFIEITLPVFRTLSLVEGDVYGKAAVYFAGILLFSLLALLPFVLRRHKPSGKGQRHVFRRVSIGFQLAISILFMFCMAVLFKQIYHLRNTDMGWERHHVAAFRFVPERYMEAIAQKVAQLPCTREVMTNHMNLLPRGGQMSIGFKDWEGKPDSIQPLTIECMYEGETFARFWGIQLLEGEMVKDNEKGKAVLNESAVKALGMAEPIGKKLKYGSDGYTVVGVMKDFHTTSPTVPVNPIMLIGESEQTMRTVVIKYHEGQWDELKTAVDELMATEFPGVNYTFINVEDVYDEYLKSEKTLLQLLTSVAVVCLLISAFGIFSLVTLTCKQRQKEIAIRKINGATVRDILAIFAREHLVLLSLSALVAFPVGYALMKHWLQTYVEQTEMSAWIFIGIFAGVAAVIALTIGWRVWRTANENPAEVIKRE